MDIALIKGTILLIGSFVNLLFLFILWTRSKSKISFYLGWIALFSAISCFIFGGTYLFQPKLFWNRACWLGVLTLPAYLIFVFHFTGRTKHIKLKSFLCYLPGIIISILALATPYVVSNTSPKYPWESIPGPLDILCRIYIIICLIIGLFYLLKKYLKSPGFRKLQLKYFILGICIYSLGGFLSVLIPSFYPKLIPALASIFWIGFSSYAIFKRRLFGIKIILTELLILVIALVLLIQFSLVETFPAKILTFIIFLLVSFISYLLIRVSQKEVQGREEAQKLAEELKQLNETLEERVSERTKELQKSKEKLEERVNELERFHKLTMGRELRMIELKKKIKELEEKKS